MPKQEGAGAGRKKVVLLALSGLGAYLLVGLGLLLWYRVLSPSRLSRPADIKKYHDDGFSNKLYEYHPRRQVTFRPDNRAERHGAEGAWMQTDERGLAYQSPNDGSYRILVLGDSVAFGSWLTYD
ncbi:MAG: hypothetical protein AAF492_15770 [Verrucomicrobiota bacterium]